MYCSKRGNELPEETPNRPDFGGASPEPGAGKGKRPFFKAPSKNAKSYAAIFTALLVFPASVCVVADLVFHVYDYWFGYVLGAIVVLWTLAVFPVLKITSPPATAIVCFFSALCYVAYVACKARRFLWISRFAMPMLVLTAAFIALDVALIGSGGLKGLGIFSFLSLQGALYCVCLEAALDCRLTGAVNLKWSLIAACGFVSAIAVLEAFRYANGINKK